MLLPILIFACALLYSTVGHAGASGYLAAMGLLEVAPAVMKPAALTLNVLVATIGTIRFARAGCFSWGVFWPFAAVSAPLAFVGGGLTLPDPVYKRVVGLVLVFAAYRLFRQAAAHKAIEIRSIPLPAALGTGGAIGLLSGLTGVGGGIFLSPLLLLMRWADPRRTAGVSAAFILVNSIAGILGGGESIGRLPAGFAWWAAAAVAGGVIGSHIGSRKLAGTAMRRMLALVLMVAAIKMILGK